MRNEIEKYIDDKRDQLDVDAPSDALWDKIEEELDEKKKRRGAYWWWGAAASVVIGVGALFLLKDNGNEKLPLAINKNPKQNSKNRAADTLRLNAQLSRPIMKIGFTIPEVYDEEIEDAPVAMSNTVSNSSPYAWTTSNGSSGAYPSKKAIASANSTFTWTTTNGFTARTYNLQGTTSGFYSVIKETKLPPISGADDKIAEVEDIIDLFDSKNENTEKYGAIEENEWKSPNREPLSTFSVDVDAAGYGNVRRFLNNDQLPPANAIKIEEMVNYFGYSYPEPKGVDPLSITTEKGPCPWNSKHQLVRIGLKAKEIQKQNIPASNLVFLIDVSGSMQAPDKLELLKKGFNLLTEQLREQDRVAIVVYAGASGVVLQPTKGSDKATILAALDKLSAGGSTAGAEGIELAYKVAAENFKKEGNNRVILATDGDFNVGVSEDNALVKLIEEKRKSGVFLTVLGFGEGNLQAEKMEKLADNGNGNYAYVDNLMEAKKVLVNEFGALYTVAKDVKLQVEFNPAKVKAYRLLGYENRMLNTEDFDNDAIDAGEMGAGHTVTAIYEIIPAESDEKVATDPELRYQKTDSVKFANNTELMYIKFRYKDPNGTESKLLKHVVYDKNTAPTEDFFFAAAVAEFGLLMRNSKFKGEASFESIEANARKGFGSDTKGYRHEFLMLVEKAKLLKKK